MGQKQYYATNGLQMMNKTLNFRETYTFETNQTMASNYYAISSALAARDVHSDLQMTVMNDRSQGGVAGLRNNNSLELMQHRRLLIHDYKGLQEPLDERDNDHRGTRVRASYWLQLHRTSRAESH